MIPVGTFKARATEAALGTTSKGGEQVAVNFQILEGEAQGQFVTWWGYFTEKTTERTLESLEHCGWQGDDLNDLAGIDRNEVYLVIEHEQDQQGELRARVRWVNAAGGIAMQNRMAPADAASFAQRMRGTVLARRQAKGQAPAAQQPRTNAQPPRRQPPLKAEPPDDSEIPF
jgi:hypothetical protein